MRRSTHHRSRFQTPRRPRPALEALEDRALPSTFTVMNLNDSGPGSLRAAVTSANTTPGADILQFAPGLKGTIPLASELSITDDLTINGANANQLAVSGSDVTRIFDISAGSVTIDRLTITGGLADSSAVNGSKGGAIYHATGTLNLVNDVVS